MLTKTIMLWAAAGFLAGVVVTATLLCWLAIAPQSDPLRQLLEVSAFLGFASLGNLHQGFPIGVSLLQTNILLAFAGGIQWSAITAMIVLLARVIRRNQSKESRVVESE